MIKTLKTVLAVAAIAGTMSIALAQNVAAQSYNQQGHHNSYSPPDPADQNNGASGP